MQFYSVVLYHKQMMQAMSTHVFSQQIQDYEQSFDVRRSVTCSKRVHSGTCVTNNGVQIRPNCYPKTAIQFSETRHNDK